MAPGDAGCCCWFRGCASDLIWSQPGSWFLGRRFKVLRCVQRVLWKANLCSFPLHMVVLLLLGAMPQLGHLCLQTPLHAPARAASQLLLLSAYMRQVICKASFKLVDQNACNSAYASSGERNVFSLLSYFIFHSCSLSCFSPASGPASAAVHRGLKDYLL